MSDPIIEAAERLLNEATIHEDYGDDLGMVADILTVARYALAARSAEARLRAMVDEAINAAWGEYDALQRFALNHPVLYEALSSPRKPTSLIMLERIRAALAEAGREGEGT